MKKRIPTILAIGALLFAGASVYELYRNNVWSCIINLLLANALIIESKILALRQTLSEKKGCCGGCSCD